MLQQKLRYPLLGPESIRQCLKWMENVFNSMIWMAQNTYIQCKDRLVLLSYLTPRHIPFMFPKSIWFWMAYRFGTCNSYLRIYLHLPECILNIGMPMIVGKLPVYWLSCLCHSKPKLHSLLHGTISHKMMITEAADKLAETAGLIIMALLLTFSTVCMYISA